MRAVGWKGGRCRVTARQGKHANGLPREFGGLLALICAGYDCRKLAEVIMIMGINGFISKH